MKTKQHEVIFGFNIKRYKDLHTFRGYYSIFDNGGNEIYKEKMTVERLDEKDALLDAKKEWIRNGGLI